MILMTSPMKCTAGTLWIRNAAENRLSNLRGGLNAPPNIMKGLRWNMWILGPPTAGAAQGMGIRTRALPIVGTAQDGACRFSSSDYLYAAPRKSRVTPPAFSRLYLCGMLQLCAACRASLFGILCRCLFPRRLVSRLLSVALAVLFLLLRHFAQW